MTLHAHNIDTPSETRLFGHGHMDVVTVGGFTMGRATFEPGWRWSNDIKPIAGTDSCQSRHTGVCVAGSMVVHGDDGTEMTIRAGDVLVIEPGHDAWTVGDEACVLFDTGVPAHAEPTS